MFKKYMTIAAGTLLFNCQMSNTGYFGRLVRPAVLATAAAYGSYDFAKPVECKPRYYLLGNQILNNCEVIRPKNYAVDTKDIYDRTPLHFASNCYSSKSVEGLQVLIEAGGDVNAKDNRGETPLHRVCDSEVAEVLIAFGANVNAKNKQGETPLHVIHGDAKTLRLLIQAGADINDRNSVCDTPLHNAVRKLEEAHTKYDIAEQLKHIKVLIDARAEVNSKNRADRTPLHLVRNVKALKLLIQAGADVNATDKQGQTPLHNVSDVEALKLLIQAGADVNATDKQGQTPLHNVHDIEALKFLIQAGADVNAKNEHGRTRLQNLVSNANRSWRDNEMIKVLVEAGAKESWYTWAQRKMYERQYRRRS